MTCIDEKIYALAAGIYGSDGAKNQNGITNYKKL
jgi:hypothetical protein